MSLRRASTCAGSARGAAREGLADGGRADGGRADGGRAARGRGQRLHPLLQGVEVRAVGLARPLGAREPEEAMASSGSGSFACSRCGVLSSSSPLASSSTASASGLSASSSASTASVCGALERVRVDRVAQRDEERLEQRHDHLGAHHRLELGHERGHEVVHQPQ